MLSGLFEFLFGGSELVDGLVLLLSVELSAVRFLLKDSFLGIVVVEGDMDALEVLVFE